MARAARKHGVYRVPMTRAALFIAADLPWPEDGGGRIATASILRAMATDRPVDLIALADSEDLDIGPLREVCRRVTVVRHPFTFRRHPVRQMLTAAQAVALRRPYRVEKFASRSLAAAIADAKRKQQYAFVHHDQFGVARYRDPRAVSTLAAHNVESDIYRMGVSASQSLVARSWSRLEAASLRRTEPGLYRGFDAVFVLSELDARHLLDVGVADAIPIPISVATRDAAPQPSPPSSATILTIGSMSWFGVEDGLLWFGREVWPRIRASMPQAEWNLVGASPGRRIRHLGAQPGIHVHGYLRDASEMVARSRVLVIPLRVAGGIRIKLLQTMAQARPSVATSIAAQGLHVADGEGCYVRDDPDGFANAVLRLLQDDADWRTTGLRGWQYIRSHHSEAALLEAVRRGVQRAMERRSA